MLQMVGAGPPHRHLLRHGEPRRVYFVTSVPEPEFAVESWSATGDLEKLRAAFAGFHEQVRRVVDACPRVHKWAIVIAIPCPAGATAPWCCWATPPIR